MCPDSGARVDLVVRTLDTMTQVSLENYCPHVTRQLRIAYNNESMPYFDLQHNHADTATLEGAILQIFIDRWASFLCHLTNNYVDCL